MYSGITKIYYRKTVGHVFTKSVRMEGTTQFFFQVSCFSSQFTFLPLGDASVCSDKMAATGRSHFVCWNITRVSGRRAVRAMYSSHHCHVTSLT